MIIHNSMPHVLELRGDFACFSRAEMKVERYSYPCPTPSAARGALEAIYFKPEFRWQIDRIELLAPPEYIALRRNEVKDKVSHHAVKQWMTGKTPVEPLWADGTERKEKGRTQRQTMALRNPRFRITARIIPRPGGQSMQKAFDSQFVRRASQGKCFQQPYLGCREFVAFFRHIESLADEPKPAGYTQDLGWMLYDVFDLRVPNDHHARPFISLFEARIEGGVLEVPPFESSRVRKPEPTGRRAD